MRSLLLCAVLPLCAGYLTTSWRDLAANPKYSFEDYLAEYGKKYAGDEWAVREKVFYENLGKIRRHNMGESGYKMGLNEFTDWTREEFKARRLGKKPDAAHDPTPAAVHLHADNLPSAVDWRDKGVVTDVYDQQECGSCWAFSATETIESMAAISGGKLTELSTEQIVSCSPNPDHCGGTGGCDGSTQPLAFNYTKTSGLSTAKSYPYNSGSGITSKCHPDKINPVVGVTSFVTLPTNNYTALLTAVATIGPVAISAAADAWQSYESGVFSKDCGYDVDHGIQLVGYGEEASGQLYWIVRNSWGYSWGESGYIRIARYGEGNEPCGMDNSPQDGIACAGDTTPKKYCGECAILSSSSYPTGVHQL
eukprot:TRINITY_DN2332_c0_g2_i1.p1 TRINITY_DN2332_c0_g2~~TRINITY_DN2332_c0_g2_i1.p1  ORF type:complete len:383 (+),score=91.74 TRINITY_DN2332_c0_g2_i1:57-1151(+)